jgi:stage II sporulation protein AA (anti-sigma F factor antagonist)
MAHGFGVMNGRCGSPGQAPGEVPVDLLQVAVAEAREGVVVVSPAGEVDVSTAGLLRRATHEAIERVPRTVVVDLSGLTFCGSTGLVALLAAREHADRRGVGFGTAGGRASMLRVLEITGFGPVLRHHERLEDALAAGSGVSAGR